MKMKIRDKVLGVLALAFVAQNAWLYLGSKKIVKGLPLPPPPAGPLCLLIGEMPNTGATNDKGFQALASMVKLQFEVNSIEECKKTARSYCMQTLDQGRSARNLTLFVDKFRVL